MSEASPWVDQQYRKKGVILAHPYSAGERITGVSISEVDAKNGSPRFGDMIATNPSNADDKWLISEKYFQDNYELTDTK